MLNFPVPYSEELLYSTVARAGIRHGIVSPKQLLDEVFASRDVIATLDLPNHISAISRWLPGKFTAERLIYNHTLFPLYAPFVPEKRRQQCVKWMLGKSQGAVHLALGIAASRLKTPGFIRFCPSCLEKQRTLHGEFFWLREWQVPGIDACPEHGALVDTRIIRPFVERHRFIAASPEHCPMVKTHKEDVFSERASRQVRQLLRFPAQRSPSFWQWTVYYHDLARQHGYRRGKSQIDHHSIRKKVLLEWSTPWLTKYDLMPNVSGNNDSDWLQSMFRKHRKSFSYLQHIIIHQALLGNNWKFSNIFKEVGQYPTEERQKNKHITPVKNQDVTPDQKSWLSLLSSSYSPKYARNQVPALYARLYRKHRDWLINVNQRYADDQTGSRKQRVNWSNRDRKCLQALQQLSVSFNDNRYGPRRSKTCFLKMLGDTSTVSKNLYRMPLSSAFLLANTESVEHYQIRRLQNIYDELLHQFASPPRWLLLRNAKLNEDRLKEPARKYLEELLSG